MEHLICVDARPLIYPGNGNARYLYNILKEIIPLRKEDHFLLLSHKSIHPDHADLLLSENVSAETDSTWTRYAGPLWLNIRIPSLLRRYNADLFWATLATMPLFYHFRLKNIPAMVNFHDLNARSAPKTMTFWNYAQHRLLNHHSVKQAEAVICLSETTRKQILHFFPDTDPSKAVTVYPGIHFRNGGSRRPKLPYQAAGRRFILSVGTLEPRKNFRTLIDGYLAAKAVWSGAFSEFPILIIAGRKGWGEESLYRLLKSESLTSDGIFFLEGLSDEELQWCYENAWFTASSSLHEGFGLPVIEAARFQTPLLLSDIEIYREVAGENAIYCMPESAADWGDKILSMTELVKFKKAPVLPVREEDWTWTEGAMRISGIADLLLTRSTGPANDEADTE